jgi:hypothetical protein
MTEKARADQLVVAAVGLADLLEDFRAYAEQSGSEELKHQAKMLWENAGSILSSRGILRFGEPGEALDPQIHTVKASAESPFPREQVVRVLQSGYVYQNTIMRKAAVVVSRGQEEAWGRPAEAGAGDYETDDDDKDQVENQDNRGDGDMEIRDDDYNEALNEDQNENQNEDQNEGGQDE